MFILKRLRCRNVNQTNLKKLIFAGTVISGNLQQGVLKKGDPLEIIGFGKSVKTAVNSMEMFHKTLDRVEAGDQAGILIKNVKRDDIKRGMIAVKTGTVQPTRGVLATVS